MTKFFVVVALVFTVLTTAYLAVKNYQLQNQAFLKEGNLVYKSDSILGVSSEEISVTADYNFKTADGSPLVFGGAHYPNLEHVKVWNQLQSLGVTSLRSDFYIDRYLPNNITLDMYRNNVNNIQDPANWNQAIIKHEKQVYQEARKRNMKTIGIVSYAVNWLTYSGNFFGVPKDWVVYEDIVRKSYRIFRDDLDYLEIWNEPDLDFLDVKNSNMTKEEAYLQIARHAVNAIRQVDAEINDGKKMKIGIGVISQPTHASMLDNLTKDKELMSKVDFISYHNYENQPEPSDIMVRNVLNKNGLNDYPLYLTEWAHTPKIKEKDDMVLSHEAIPYAGAKFIDFLNMGIKGANYFALQMIAPNSPRGDEGFLGFYTERSGQTSLLPISRSWALVSKTLGLGNGPSNIFKTSADTGGKVAAWQNSTSTYGLVVANSGEMPQTYSISVQNLPITGAVIVNGYAASKDHDGTQKIGSVTVPNNQSSMTFKIVAPPSSVVGVTFAKASLVDRIPALP